MAVQLSPSLATNFKNVDGEHVRFSAVMLFFYQFSKRFSLGFGAIANYAFGSLLPLPGLEVVWRPTERWHVYVFLPSNLRVAWRALPFMDVGVGSALAGNRYMISDICDPSDLTRPCNNAVESLVYSVIDVHAFVDFKLYGWLWFSLRGGHTLWRNFDVLDTNNNSVGGRDFDNAPIFGVRLALRPPLQPLED